MNHDSDTGGDVDGDECLPKVSYIHSLMFFPTGGLLQGWRLGRENHTFPHRRLYTEELYTRTRLHTESFNTQKALNRGAFTQRRLYTGQLFRTEACRTEL